ncbi:MAG: acyltransferase [Erysipelotrichaceae bacterium]|nr:acyltransferase [Erysipelotrichaceae bacterium]
MKQNKINYDKINYGFSLLKMLMAFEVLLGHFADWSQYDPRIVWPFRELVSLAVPSFVIMSFYLTERSFLNRDDEKFKVRFKKLLIPQIAWAFIYYIIYALIDLFMHKKLHSGITDLFWQILTGHSSYLNPSMWYQFDIIITTVLFFLVFRQIKDNKKAYCGLLIITLFCYILQFSGVNRALFGEMIFELKYPLGRIIEMIPFATIGFSLRYFDVFEKLKKYRWIVMVLCVALFLLGFHIPWPELKDFGFAGFAKPYLALCIVTFAFLTPLEKLSLPIKKAIIKISDYSLGIYCIHRLINTLLKVFIPSISLQSFERCVLLYIICYFICFLIDLLPDKNTKLLVN